MKPLIGGLCILLSISCEKETERISVDEPAQRVRDYIRKIPGENDPIPEALADRGEVLVAYSGCYDCHRREKRSKGPAFSDIAERYPVQEVYLDMLARKVITGGTGSWGSPVMTPHPHLKLEDAKIMVTYILSLKRQ
ncbi:c-type cytochrome [Negadavirga shengliensis]|uniref:C-type cytochrome n=1 Tax=Negadavirga shengliensis TaxID=1389218 RepID=A0ABV9T2G7_9BACT